MGGLCGLQVGRLCLSWNFLCAKDIGIRHKATAALALIETNSGFRLK